MSIAGIHWQEGSYLHKFLKSVQNLLVIGCVLDLTRALTNAKIQKVVQSSAGLVKIFFESCLVNLVRDIS